VGRTHHEDFSDFVGEEVAKRRRVAEKKKSDQAKEKFKF
jgi:splicing factor 3B subunit 2